MRWTERQAAMLAELGLRLPPAAPTRHVDPPATRVEDAPADVAVATPERAPRGDRAVGVDQMDWAALRQAVADCRGCKLCDGRRQTVFGVGHPQAHWMVV